MQRTIKLDYYETVQLFNDICTVKEISEGHTVVIARLSKQVLKVFEDLTTKVQELLEDAKRTKTILPYPKECKDEREIKITNTQLASVGEAIVEIIKDKSREVNQKMALIEIADKIFLKRYIDKYCEVDKIQPLEIEEDDALFAPEESKEEKDGKPK